MADDAISQAIFSSIEGIEDGGGSDDYTGDSGGGIDGGDSGDKPAVLEGQAEGAEGKAGGTGAAAGTTVAEVEDKLAKELGIDAKRKNNLIPYSRVKDITTNRERKVAERVAQLFGLEGDDLKNVSYDKLDELFEKHYTGKINEFTGELEPLRERHRVYSGIEHLIKENPQEYLERLALAQPYFRQFVLGGEKPKPKVAAGSVEAEDDGEMPGADVNWEDGTKTYSMAGFNKRLEWERRQALKAHKAELTALEQKFKPLLDRERARTIQTDSANKVTQMLERNRKTLPGFEENEGEILNLFKSDKNMTVHDAYSMVMGKKHKAEVAKLQADILAARQGAREDTLKEIAKAKPDTSVAAGATDTEVAEDGVDNITAAIRKSIAGIK